MDIMIGLAFSAIGAILVALGLLHRRRALAGARQGGGYSLGMIGEIARGLVVTGVVLGGLNILRTFLAVGGNGVLSAFGIAGFLFMLAGFVVWFVIRTKYTGSQPPAS